MKLLIGIVFTGALFAAATFPTTTLRIALVGWPSPKQPTEIVYLESNAAFVPIVNPISTNGTGNPSGHTKQILFIDTEAMCVSGPLTGSGGVPVERGCEGTSIGGHSAGSTVFVGYQSYYPLTIPYGSCSSVSINVLPVVYILNAGVYNCVAGTWTYEGQAGSYHPMMVHAPQNVSRAFCRPQWYRRFGAWLKRAI